MFTIEPTVVGYFQLCLHIFTIQRKKNNDGIVINELWQQHVLIALTHQNKYIFNFCHWLYTIQLIFLKPVKLNLSWTDLNIQVDCA